MINNLNELDVLGLKPNEKEVILVISKMAKNVAQISRHSKLPRSTVVYILKKLQDKSFARSSLMLNKKVWRSNIPKILIKMKYLQNMKERKESRK